MDLFGTAGIRGDARTRVTPRLALAVGQALGTGIGEQDSRTEHGRREEPDGAPEVVIARDGRDTGPALAAAMEAGVASTGVRPVRAGQLPTPALAFASRGRRGVMLTASHNPPHDNGIKLFSDGSEFPRELETAIEEAIAKGTAPAAWDAWTEAETTSVLPAYRRAVVEYASTIAGIEPDDDPPLAGMRIAVDCGNGMASLATPPVLRELGASVLTLNGNVDGHFPGRESKPTPESLSDLRRFLADADDVPFGIGHDGDADRIVLVDTDGEVIHEDTVLAILAEEYVRQSAAGGRRPETTDPVVVTTPNASSRIDERVRTAGGRVERVRLGALHEGIAGIEANGGDVVFAAEPWKHIHTAFGRWIDGVASAAVTSCLVARESLDTLREPVSARPYRKVSVDCPDDRKVDAMERLSETLPAAFPEADVSTEHGIRLSFPDDSWLLVRPSGTEPYVRLYAESDDVDDLVDRARGKIESAVDTAQ
ncbi:phosphomannomutase [Halalkaliarchaeum desulfuricum]|uniref:Phosphomannomutase n=1 Tax=Halalkaliarchaeum desulfuricum TaxID=2055893 RepID=A0A343TKZ4_9EURY|nr:phosphomannomutase [Halalkaliarchaeum desulfuricum]AUX09766.1 phosphomannomutase [Halalkaliarchaeum desulfuricum]